MYSSEHENVTGLCLLNLLPYQEEVAVIISTLLVNNHLRLNAFESLLANERCAFEGSLLHLEENDLSTFLHHKP